MKISAIALCVATILVTNLTHASMFTPQREPSVGVTEDVAFDIVSKYLSSVTPVKTQVIAELKKLSPEGRLQEAGRVAMVMTKTNQENTPEAMRLVQQLYQPQTSILRALTDKDIDAKIKSIQEVQARQIREQSLLGQFASEDDIGQALEQIRAALRKISGSKQSSLEVEFNNPNTYSALITELAGQGFGPQGPKGEIADMFMQFVMQVRGTRNQEQLQGVYNWYKTVMSGHASPTLEGIAQRYVQQYQQRLQQ